MGKFIDLTGQRFGRLSVISRAENDKNGNVRWLCLCDCGNEVIVSTKSLKNGHTKSCGCLHAEKVRELCKKMNITRVKHRLSKTRLYSVWSSMKTRCTNHNCVAYKNYGGRGVLVCAEWTDREKGFINFYNWAMANGYREDLTLDRVDVNGNYEPYNCKFSTSQEQTDNRRCSKTFIYEGVEYKSIAEASRRLGIPSTTLRYRAKKQKEREENGD